MKRHTLKNIDVLCAKLRRASGSPHDVARLVGDGIRQKTLHKGSLPLILQRFAQRDGDWCLALRVLQCGQLQNHGVSCDANIWRIIERSLPEDPSAKAAAREVMIDIFSK